MHAHAPLEVGATLMTVLLLAVPAAAASGPPDLSGTWSQSGAAGAPPWQLQASGAGLATLHASWRGTGAHAKLVGSFDGTLGRNGDSYVYSGGYAVKEPGGASSGTMTFVVVSDTKLVMSYTQSNGTAASNVVFERVGTAPSTGKRTATLESVESTEVFVSEAPPVRAGPIGGALVPIAPGVGIPVGFQIQTQPFTKALITLPNGATLLLGGPGAPPDGVHVELQKDGTVFVSSGGGAIHELRPKPGHAYAFRWLFGSPSVVTAVMGTDYSIYVDPVTHTTVVSVTSGRVKVMPRGGGTPVALGAGQEVQVSSAGASAVAPIGLAGAPTGAIARTAALRLLGHVVNGRTLGACKAKLGQSSISPTSNGWRIAATLTGSLRGSALWSVVGSRLTAANATASRLGAGCRGGGTPASGPRTPAAAIALVKALLARNAGPCRLDWTRIEVSGRPGRWSVVAHVTAKGSPGTAHWTIVGTTLVAGDPLAADLQHGCP